MSSITRKTNGKWYARWRDPTGKQRARTFGRKVDAERFLATVTVDVLQGRYIDPRAGRITVAEFARRWAAAQPWRETTRGSRETILEAHVLPTFGAMPLQAVRKSDVQAWVGRMTAAGLAAGTVALYFRTLAAIMFAARADRLIYDSPCVVVRLPREDSTPTALVPLTSEQVHRIAEEVPGHYRALVLVSAGLGLRQGEACGLTVDRIDFLRRRVRIDRQVITPTKAPRAPYFGPPKTPTSNRVLPLPGSVAEVLAAHLAEYGEGPDRLVFRTIDDRMLGRHTWHAAFTGAARRARIGATTHDLRHHAASLLIASGCSPRAVATFLGHKNAAETLNTYAHLWPSDEDRIMSAIDSGLSRSVRETCAVRSVDAT